MYAQNNLGCTALNMLLLYELHNL